MLRLVFWIILLYLLYRILSRWVLPLLVRKYVERAKSTYQQKQEGGRRIPLDDGEGEIIIPKRPSQQKDTKKAGSQPDYTPFEEVEE